MAIAFFLPNAIVIRNGERFKLVKQFADGIWKMDNVVTGRSIEACESDLHTDLSKGNLYFPDAMEIADSMQAIKVGKQSDVWNSASDSARAEARRRFAYVSSAIGAPKSATTLKNFRDQVRVKLNDYKPPCISTLKSWVSRYQIGRNDIASLLPKTKKRGNRTRRYRDELEEIVDRSLETMYLTQQRPTMCDVRLHAATHIAAHNKLTPANDNKFIVPNIDYFWRRLRSTYNEFDICCARFGQAYAARRYETVQGFARGERPLDRVEIDHTVIDLTVVDGRSGLPLGRPYLTLAIDDDTRCILGYYLSFEPPSYLSVSYCLRHAILSKSYLKEIYPDIKNTWDCYGVFTNLVVDNGSDFHSIALEDLAKRFGTTIQYCPRAKPRYKGKIERLYGTMNRGLFHTLPGTTFSNIVEKDDYDSLGNAVISLEKLHEIIHIWIVDFYHQKKQTAIGEPPASRWRKHISGIPIPVPASVIDLEATLAVPFERTLSRNGIEHLALEYNSDECGLYLARMKGSFKVKCRYNPNDLGHIYIEEHDTDHVFKVPIKVKWRDYATGLSRWQHQLCQRFAAKNLEKEDIFALAEAKEKIAQIVEEEIFVQKKRTRARVARYQGETARSAKTKRDFDGLSETSKKRNSTSHRANEDHIYPFDASSDESRRWPSPPENTLKDNVEFLPRGRK
tara:strand:+ start:848055 stop:850091 length:2037 start_codon:yes stop_codon:yes gene_type:complete